MAGPSNQQYDFQAILRDCDRARDLFSQLLQLRGALDDLKIYLEGFNDRITNLLRWTAGYVVLGYLGEKLTELSPTLLTYENITGYHYWMKNRYRFDNLLQEGLSFEVQVRDRARRQRPPNPQFLADMRTFIRDARRALEDVQGGSNAVHVAAMKEGAAIVREEFGLFERTFGASGEEAGTIANLVSNGPLLQRAIMNTQQMTVNLVDKARASSGISYIFPYYV